MAELNFNRLSNAGFMSGFNRGQEQRREQENQLAEQQLKQQANMQAQQFNALKMQGYQEDRTSKMRAEKAALFRDSILRAPDPNTAREVIKRQYADSDLGPLLQQTLPLDAALSEISDDPVEFKKYIDREALGIEGYAKSQLPKTVGNRVFDPRTMSYIEPVERPQVAAPSAPVAVMGADGRPQYVSREQALGMTPFTPASVKFIGGGAGGGGGAAAMPKAPAGYRYTPTGDLEAIPGGPAAAGPNLTPKDIQKREAVLPQARQAVSTVSNTMSIIGETVDRLIANKSGLNGVTGLISGRTPGITDAARKAEADLNQLKNLAFIQGITELRAASKTGAGVGNVSNKEGDRFENLKASLERTQSYDDIVAALKRLKSQSEFTKQSLKEAFDETYSYRNAAPDASNAAQERANANAAIAAGAPAAAVRQRFKEKTGQEL
jgi:hypothetical protein